VAATVLSMARESHGWQEQELLWRMRFAKLVVYQHAALRGLGVWTVGPQPAKPAVTDQDVNRLLEEGADEWI